MLQWWLPIELVLAVLHFQRLLRRLEDHGPFDIGHKYSLCVLARHRLRLAPMGMAALGSPGGLPCGRSDGSGHSSPGLSSRAHKSPLWRLSGRLPTARRGPFSAHAPGDQFKLAMGAKWVQGRLVKSGLVTTLPAKTTGMT